MEKRLIARGLVAGALGSLVAFVFARLFVEPIIGRAIEFEDGRSDAEHASGVHEHGVELFSRGVQSSAGLGFGVLMFGMAIGALFAVVFCVVLRRESQPSPRATALSLALAAFGVVYLAPSLKYPANPPAVGQADTIAARTGWYLVMVGLSIALAAAATIVARRLTERFGAWNGRLLAALAYAVAIGVVFASLPAVDETPKPLRGAGGVIVYPGFPADDLYEFRLLSVATQLIMWATMGLVFATLAGRLLDPRNNSDQAPSIAA